MFYQDLKEMNEKQISEAIALLKKVIKNGAIKYNPEHADPTQEYCFISSSDVKGLFFPNTEFVKNEYYKIVAVGMGYDNKYYLVEESKNTGKYYLTELRSLLYTYDELNAIEAIEREESQIKEELKALKLIDYKTKKNGEPFQDLPKNIKEINGEYSIKAGWGGYNNNSVKVYTYNNTGRFYASVEIWLNDNKTIDELKTTVKAYIENREKQLKRYAKEKANIKKYFKKINDFKKIINALDPSYTLKEAIEKALKYMG